MTGRALPVQCQPAKTALATLVAILLGSELAENIPDKTEIPACIGRILCCLQFYQFLQARHGWLLTQSLDDESLRGRLAVARADQFHQGQQGAHTGLPARHALQVETELCFVVQIPEGRCHLVNHHIQVSGILLFDFLPGKNGITVIPLRRGDTAGKHAGTNTLRVCRQGVHGA